MYLGLAGIDVLDSVSLEKSSAWVVYTQSGWDLITYFHNDCLLNLQIISRENNSLVGVVGLASYT